MSNEHRTDLCLGGPLDGQRYDVGDVSTFRVPLRSPMRVAEIEDMRRVSAAVTTEHVLYVLTWFNTPDGRVSFWTPYGTTPLDAMRQLVEGYRRGAS